MTSSKIGATNIVMIKGDSGIDGQLFVLFLSRRINFWSGITIEHDNTDTNSEEMTATRPSCFSTAVFHDCNRSGNSDFPSTTIEQMIDSNGSRLVSISW